MSYRTTVVLVALLAIAAGYMYFFTPKEKEPEFADYGDLSVLRMEVGTMRSLEVRRGDSVVSVKRNPQGGWDLVAPQQAEGDQPRIANVMETLSFLSASRVLTTGVSNLIDFGLDKPDTQVTIGIGSAEFIQLFIGSPNPSASSYYVKKSGSDSVFLVDAYSMNLLKTLINPLPIAQPTPTPEPGGFPTPPTGS
ncbi:MAG: DUF4340 domain-containing protein [Dehalococcoidia bacterium]|nr:DUF4340 domain-containing protein [Dehalococcoidia bacterium]